MHLIPVKIQDLPLEYQQAYKDLGETTKHEKRQASKMTVRDTGPMTLIELALLVVSFLNIGYYLYSIKAVHSMGGAYYEPMWIIVYLVVPLPSIHLSCGVFYAMTLLLFKPDT